MINPLQFVPEITVDNLQLMAISIQEITDRIGTNYLSACLGGKHSVSVSYTRFFYYNLYFTFLQIRNTLSCRGTNYSVTTDTPYYYYFVQFSSSYLHITDPRPPDDITIDKRILLEDRVECTLGIGVEEAACTCTGHAGQTERYALHPIFQQSRQQLQRCEEGVK